MNDDSIARARDASQDSGSKAPEPPRVYFLACGAQCDVFWWARRSAAAEPAPPPQKPAHQGGE